ncbi:hypothetical protein Bca52824_035148 [Brassica carinata]|uniref:Uncharacterized protein n=1 Tax=Brassica carinata TaxID=52824 RepID=A0A8X7S336_BRACI|nr:hypothetical protein Bca52824_035148 [Brassica carinata]
MPSRSRSSKKNSSSHSSSGDSPVDEVVAPKHEERVEEDAREAYYTALCGSSPPPQDIPIPKDLTVAVILLTKHGLSRVPHDSSKLLPRLLRTLMLIFSSNEIFFGKGHSSGVPFASSGFEMWWSSIDPESFFSLPMFRVMSSRLLPCLFGGGDIGLGKAKRSNTRRSREILRC